MRKYWTCLVVGMAWGVLAQDVECGFHATADGAVRQAHAELCGRLLSPQGLLWDYVGELPTPDDCRECRPNAMGWWSPIENGPMFTGPWLASMAARARRTGEAADRELCRKLADGLLLAASVSDVPGMVVRGVGTDGRCHYPFGSLDQTLPWYFGLYVYWRSGLADSEQAQRIRDKLLEVTRALEAKNWNVPTDGSFRGNFCGDFTHNDLAFRGATHYLFLLRALADLTGDPSWLEKYAKARREPCRPSTVPREDVCAAGCMIDKPKYDCDGMGIWIYVAAQGCLAELHRLETDPVVKGKYRQGLDRTAEASRKTLEWSKAWRNTRETPFRYANWRTGYRWKVQKTHRDALGVAGSGNPDILGTRKELERRQVSCPLAAAAICTYAGKYRAEVERTLCRYDYSTVNISEFFTAEIAWWGLDPASAVEYVDPMIGSAATGHAFPGPCRPFGLVQPSPDTGNGSWRYCSGYNAEDSAICRFSQTHLNGTGQAGLGDVALLPFVGELPENVADFSCAFAKSNETSRLGYYAVRFDNGVRVEIASGRRIARYRLAFPSGRKGGLLLDFPYGLYRERGYLKNLTTSCEVEKVSNRRVRGLNHSEIWASRDIGYVIEFNRDADAIVELPRKPTDKGPRQVAWFNEGGSVEVTVAVSAHSIAGAERNLAAEAGRTFEELVDETRAEWGELLARVKVPEQVDAEVRRSVYTSVYHLFIQPNDIADAGEKPRYSTFSLWDTFRDAHPLYEQLIPERIPGMVDSMLEHYRQYGYLPQWELWGRETGGMIGSHAVPVVVDACLHGFKDIDRELVFRAVKDTLTKSVRPGIGRTYPIRTDWEVLDRYGYYPYDVIRRESVSRTLECCFDDFKAMELARALGKTEDAAFFERRSWNFTNIFDRTTMCFRPKNSKGEWLASFNPAGLSAHFTEGSALQWSWYVLHRPEWLVTAMGGREAFVKRLDAFFAGTLFKDGDRGKSQDITGLIGDYAHGNEPCHHVVGLYRLVGENAKADALCRRICTEFYRASPGGLCGNDDCGQMSAWYLRNLKFGK